MKKSKLLFFTVLVTCSILVISTVPVNAAVTVFTNPGFETGDTTGWADIATPDYSVQTGNPRTGTYHAEVDLSDGSTGVFYQDITGIEVDSVYAFGGYVRSYYGDRENQWCLAQIEFGSGATYNPAEKIGTSHQGNDNDLTATYQLIEVTAITAPATAQSARVSIQSDNMVGTAQSEYHLIDDCYLSEDGSTVSEFGLITVTFLLAITPLALALLVHRRKEH